MGIRRRHVMLKHTVSTCDLDLVLAMQHPLTCAKALFMRAIRQVRRRVVPACVHATLAVGNCFTPTHVALSAVRTVQVSLFPSPVTFHRACISCTYFLLHSSEPIARFVNSTSRHSCL